VQLHQCKNGKIFRADTGNPNFPLCHLCEQVKGQDSGRMTALLRGAVSMHTCSGCDELLRIDYEPARLRLDEDARATICGTKDLVLDPRPISKINLYIHSVGQQICQQIHKPTNTNSNSLLTIHFE
jgi:hypothetical protein